MPLVANVIAGPVTDPSAIRKNLVTQVSGSVRWRESMKWMLENDVTKQLEVGAGKVLTGLIRRMDKQIEAAAFGGPGDIEGAKALYV